MDIKTQQKTIDKPIFDSSNVFTDLSGEFASRLMQGQCFLVCGSKGSGKTSAMFAVIRACMDANAFDQYHLVIPSYTHEASNTYGWLEQFRKRNKNMIKIYDNYGEIISKNIINDSIKEKQNGKIVRKILLLDDATSAPLFHIESNYYLKQMITCARHYPCSLIFIVHSLKGVLSNIIKDNVLFICISDISSYKLLHDLYEAYYSIIMTFDEFLNIYRKHSAREHGMLLLYNAKNKKIDLDMLEWKAIKTALDKNLKSENKTPQKDVKTKLKL